MGRLVAAALVGVAVVVAVVAALGGGGKTAHARHPRPAKVAPRPRVSRVRLGRSVRGRPIDAIHIGTGGRADLLVVGCIHGNEPAGIAVTRMLPAVLAGRSLDAWVVDDLNPDGRRADTRANAHGVDLNRNFPYRWRTLGAPGTGEWSGRGPLSEPESRAAARLIRRVRPRISIWFHQPLRVVDESGGSVSVERRFSRLAHMPLRRLTRYPGSVAGWEDHILNGSTAFVVELPPGRLGGGAVQRLAHAVVALSAPPRPPSRARSARPSGA
jgi:murein peptide amidase A